MKALFLAAVSSLALAGCQSTAGFFGTADPCAQAELGYAAFKTIAATSDKIPPKVVKAADVGIVAFREQCSDGQYDKLTLSKAVRAYVAGLNAWKQ